MRLRRRLPDSHYVRGMKTLVAVLSATALSLALAACGDDTATDPTGSNEAKALTRSELIEQGDAICKASNDRIEAGSAEFEAAEPTEADLLAFITETVFPEVEGQARDLRELVPPAGDAEEIDAMLDSLEAQLAQGKADPNYLMSGEAGFVEANELARDYGFKVCGEE